MSNTCKGPLETRDHYKGSPLFATNIFKGEFPLRESERESENFL